MAEHISIADMHQKVNQEISGLYLVAEKELREGKNDLYLRLKLQDKTCLLYTSPSPRDS